MLIIKDISNLNTYLKAYKSNNYKIGLVPTMGGLHQGHRSLFEASREHNEKTIVSIFLNPKQFNNDEDLRTYPTNKGNDYDFCVKNNIDVIFEPTQDEIYPTNFKSLKNINFNNILCDNFRPGHFNGVVTVVSELFKIIEPLNTYFGFKDFQQFKIIESLAKEKFPHIKVNGIETVRDENGLALSTRNNLLNSFNREIYKNFIDSLRNFTNSLETDLENKDANTLIKNFIEENKNTLNKFEYHEFRSSSDLTLNGTIKNSRLFFAFYLDTIRIIDNFKI